MYEYLILISIKVILSGNRLRKSRPLLLSEYLCICYFPFLIRVQDFDSVYSSSLSLLTFLRHFVFSIDFSDVGFNNIYMDTIRHKTQFTMVYTMYLRI